MNATQPPAIFDRRLVRLRRKRAHKTIARHGFLHQRAMDDIVDRLELVKRDFPDAVFFGAGDLIDRLTPACGVGNIHNADSAIERLPACGGIVFDEDLPPLAAQRFNLIVSILTLHTANDPVGALAQALSALRPDGLYIAAVFGEETLSRLRHGLYAAEAELTGGVSARIAPFATIQNFGQALSRAGFALPVVDVDKISVQYSDPAKLIRDIRAMGETKTLTTKSAPLTRSIMARALKIFADNGGAEKFDILYLTGWAPHHSQQKPLAPGSAKQSLAKAVKGA